MSSYFGRLPPNIEGMTSLKVDNLTYRTTSDDLKRAFEKYGDVGDVYIPRDKWTKESRGFAFVRFYDKRDAEDAMDRMDGKILDGRELRVQMARYGRPSPPQRYGGRYRSRRSRSRSRSSSRSRSYRKRRRSRSRSGSRSRRSNRSRSRSRSSRGRSRSRSRSRSHRRSGSKSRSRSRSLSKDKEGSKSPERMMNHGKNEENGERGNSRSP